MMTGARRWSSRSFFARLEGDGARDTAAPFLAKVVQFGYLVSALSCEERNPEASEVRKRDLSSL